MRIEAIVASGLVLASASFALGQAKAAPAKKANPDMVTGPLLRMDLLERNEGPFVGVKRDPFIPGPFTQASDVPPMAGSRLGLPASSPASGLRTGPPAGEEDAPAEPVVNLRYVGFIQGREKLLALVLFNGQAVAVAAGETLGGVWKVARITAGEIEIQGPDGAALNFVLEGERK